MLCLPLLQKLILHDNGSTTATKITSTQNLTTILKFGDACNLVVGDTMHLLFNHCSYLQHLPAPHVISLATLISSSYTVNSVPAPTTDLYDHSSFTRFVSFTLYPPTSLFNSSNYMAILPT